ncbi:MAG TPA: DUF924 family protein [Caulobacteraceae bacterium]|jgi:uncharacterized protein (DUF924 family)|nr:DUF924 family protein [Caulobacteraceae bacterium]
MAAQPTDVLNFWRAAGPGRWFEKDDAFDAAIRLKFEPTHHAAARGEYDGWVESADGALALLILLDQFPRNLYRGSAHSYATDGLARRITREAIALGHDKRFESDLRNFFYLPFEHAEALADQDHAIALFEAMKAETGDPGNLKWALIHRDVIARFGRFPHRNHALGRETTPEEQAFLDEGGFAG